MKSLIGIAALTLLSTTVKAENTCACTSAVEGGCGTPTDCLCAGGNDCEIIFKVDGKDAFKATGVNADCSAPYGCTVGPTNQDSIIEDLANGLKCGMMCKTVLEPLSVEATSPGLILTSDLKAACTYDPKLATAKQEFCVLSEDGGKHVADCNPSEGEGECTTSVFPDVFKAGETEDYFRCTASTCKSKITPGENLDVHVITELAPKATKGMIEVSLGANSYLLETADNNNRLHCNSKGSKAFLDDASTDDKTTAFPGVCWVQAGQIKFTTQPGDWDTVAASCVTGNDECKCESDTPAAPARCYFLFDGAAKTDTIECDKRCTVVASGVFNTPVLSVVTALTAVSVLFGMRS